MTANELIKASLRAINAIDPNETPKNYLMTLGLEAMNIMLDSWAADGLMVYFETFEDFSLTGGDYDLSIGNAGGEDLSTARPTRVTNAYTTGSGVNVPMRIISKGKYRALILPEIQSVPIYLYYNSDYPSGMIYLYPSPQGGLTLYLSSLKQSTDAVAGTDVDFPPEYSAPIKWNLAEELSTEHGKNVSPIVSSRAITTKRTVQNLNAANQIVEADLDIARINRRYGGRYNIDAG